LLPGELREPVAGLCPNAHDEEENVHGPVAIETCADGKDLADGQRGSSDDDGACKPCQPGWHGRWSLLCSFSASRFRTTDAAPENIAEAEDEQCFCKPEWTEDEFLAMPERYEGGPEAVSLRKCHKRGGQWAKDQAESQNRDAKTNEAVEDELAVAFAIQGRGCEIAGQEEEEAHKVGLVRGAEENEQNAGRRAGGLDFAPEPAADGSIGDGGVMQDDQDGHHGAEAVDVEVALRHAQ